MTQFVFQTPRTIISSPGAASTAESFKAARVSGKVLLVTDKTLCSLGLVDPVINALKDAGCEVSVYADVAPEPYGQDVSAAADKARTGGIEQVVALGGGSPMDVAKLIAVLIPCPQEMEGMYGVGNIKGERLPLTLIPTTAGTGSEGTAVAVVTSDSGDKSPILGQQMLCDNVILDPTLTLGLPPKVTADTGVDAMVHAVEAYTSATRKNPISDRLAMEAFELLFSNIRTVVNGGGNVEARGKMLLGSMLAGLAFANATVGAVHALAYPLGTSLHMSHGASNSMVFTPVMRFNLPDATHYYADLARQVLTLDNTESDQSAAVRLIEELEKLIPELGLQTKLSEAGASSDDLDTLTDGALHQERLLSYNIRSMTRADILGIYQSIL